MGCDIHIFMERKNSKGEWVCAHPYEYDKYNENEFEPQDYYERNYNLFAILAGVRSYGNTDGIISQPRGVPDDCCEQYRKFVERWGEDGHSHSYFTMRELMVARDKTKYLTTYRTLDSFIHHLNMISQVMTVWKQAIDEPDDWRVCFFFDN